MDILIMCCAEGFYPITSSGLKHLKDEAKDHGERNDHILRIEDIEGNTLWSRIN